MFNKDDIEQLDYDFSGFFEGGSSGVVPEPSTEAISAYQLAISNLLDSTNERGAEILKKPETDEEEGLSEEEKNAALDRLNSETWTQRKHLLAELCQGSPSFEEINRLGHRVFMKFEDYCLGKWTPQAASAATS